MAGDPAHDPATVWTVGHSTRTWDGFLGVLAAHRIEALVDVRRFPGSRRHPWFASEAMARALPGCAVDYHWLPELGGRRKARPGSPNGGWSNAAFQGYADHMASAEFALGLGRALAVAATRRTAFMCAEALWWQCHRRLISDLLQHRGLRVLHILDEKPAQPHPGNPMAQAAGRDLIYPPLQAGLFPT
ncbi:MAG TPA: hypothetical protein DDZ67_01250 [Xanthomonadaceae bacterium]|nr:hypothetical protein [Xanthomonadaceae bacterium]